MLDNKCAITIEQFKRSNLFVSSSQWIDSRKLFTRRGAAIASGIYELFGQYSGKSGSEVCEDLLAWISENKHDVRTCVKIVLDHKGYNLSYWMTKMSRIQTPAYDIAIYCLARMYRRHVLIHNLRVPWSTLTRQYTMSVEELISHSEIKLLLLGEGKFAEIRNIRTPTLPGTWPCPTHNIRNGKLPQAESKIKNRKRNKTTCREGHKPGFSVVTRQSVKLARETSLAPSEKTHSRPHRERTSTRPLRDNRCDIDYSLLNDGYDVVTNLPKKRRCHSSRPRSEPTAPRKAAQKRIVETKTHLTNASDNLDLETILDSQLSGIMDDTKPLDVEYVTPVLGTLTVHGVTDTKLDLDVLDLEELAMNEDTTPNLTSSPKRLDALVDDLLSAITDNSEDNTMQINKTIETANTLELHGVTMTTEKIVSSRLKKDIPLMTPVTDLPDTSEE